MRQTVRRYEGHDPSQERRPLRNEDQVELQEAQRGEEEEEGDHGQKDTAAERQVWPKTC